MINQISAYQQVYQTQPTMQQRLSNHDVTVHKLRKLLGIEKSSEALSCVGKSNKGNGKHTAGKNRKPKENGEDSLPLSQL